MKILKIGVKRGDVSLVEIDGTLESMQEVVGGYIEPCAPVELKACDIELFANEEGLLAGLEPNENLYPFFFVGTLFMCAVEGDELVGLSDGQVEFCQRWLKLLIGCE